MFVRRYANLVYAIASRAGLDSDEAADVFQAVFVIVWRNLELLDEPQAFPGWLATIARRDTWRLVRGKTRGRKRAELFAADPTAAALPSNPARADEALERAERGARIRPVGCGPVAKGRFWEPARGVVKLKAATQGRQLHHPLAALKCIAKCLSLKDYCQGRHARPPNPCMAGWSRRYKSPLLQSLSAFV